MSLDFSKLNAVANAIAATSANANEAKKGGGGGDYTPPAAGLVRLRFVAYVEVGQHFSKGNPAKRIPDKNVDMAWLVFECSGPKHEPKVLEDGTKIPQRITVKLNKSLNEKAHYYKLFKKMNIDGQATHFSQLLGQPYLGTIRHDVWKDRDGKERVTAYLDDQDRVYTVRAPRIEREDPDTGDTTIVPVKVAEPISDLRLFVWNADDSMIGDLWQSIYIAKTGDGDYDPNVFQNKIKEAVNFEGSAIQKFLAARGEVADIPAATKADDLGLDDGAVTGSTQAGNDDPLDGM